MGAEVQAGLVLDGEGNLGSFESMGVLSGVFGTLGSGFTVTWNGDADNIYALEGDGIEVGVIGVVASAGWSASANSSYDSTMCGRAGGDDKYLNGLFVSGGGEGYGLGAYLEPTETAIQKWLNFHDRSW